LSNQPIYSMKVELIQEVRQQLEQLINKGKVAGYKIKHAHLLLKADEGENGTSWPDTRINRHRMQPTAGRLLNLMFRSSTQ